MRSMNLSVGAIVAGRFRLSRLLGSGGMGSVWEATHLTLDVACAVKFIEGDLAHLAEARARFEREARAAARLRSPHAVQILDYGVSCGVPYIAMELLIGEDLGQRLARVGRLSPDALHTIVAQVCRALVRAHALGIVHRDLKPENIFLVRDDDAEIAKVLDFGIAKWSAGNSEHARTRTGDVMGTPHYMSPEQARGDTSVDHRSDLWSLAVIAFECVVGVRPFDCEALGGLIVKLLVEPLPIPSQMAAVPPTFDAWWAKAASRDPSERFQSARELSDSLGAALGIETKRAASHVRAHEPALAATLLAAGIAPRTTAVAISVTPTGFCAPTLARETSHSPRRSIAIAMAATALLTLAATVVLGVSHARRADALVAASSGIARAFVDAFPAPTIGASPTPIATPTSDAPVAPPTRSATTARTRPAPPSTPARAASATPPAALDSPRPLGRTGF